MASLGTTQKLFRFYAVNLLQDEDPQTNEIAVGADLSNSATSLFKSYTTS
jgi:hypothetical protein